MSPMPLSPLPSSLRCLHEVCLGVVAGAAGAGLAAGALRVQLRLLGSVGETTSARQPLHSLGLLYVV